MPRLAMTLAAYWNSFSVPLVFDDLLTIQRNTLVRFGEFYWNLLSARSVLYLTFTLNYMLSGQEVWSYHLVNFLLHFLNGLLVFVLGERTFQHIEGNPQRCRTYAVLAAAFFLVHPVQTESVSYISSRSELLSTFFYLAGFLVFLLWPRHRIGFLCSLAVGILYFFGLGSKETVITLPATLFLYDFLFLSKSEFRPILTRWRFYLTYVLGASAAVYYVLTVALKGSVGGGLAGHVSSWHYLLTQNRVVARYIWLVVFPVGQNLDYDFRLSTSLLEPGVIGSCVFLCGLLFLGWWFRRRAPVFSFSILWFFISLSPTSSVVPVADVIFEHRLYLPLVGVCMSFPLLMELAYGKMRQRFAISGSALAYSGLILMALIIGTVLRNHVWSDEVRLWKDVVSKSPRKERPYNALAFAYYKRADYENAINVLEKGRNMMPDKLAEISDSLGNFYLKTGRYDQAVELFRKTTGSVSGDRAVAYNNLGVAYLYKWNSFKAKRGQLSEEEFATGREQILRPAAEAFQKALEMDHDMSWALDSYVNVSSYRGKGAEIEAAALERLKKKEEFNDLYTVGKIAFTNEDYARADQYFERAEKLRNDVKILFFNHGYALGILRQDDRAIEKYIQAIRVDPIFIEAHHNLGLIYMRRNEYAKAAEAFTEVLRQDPKHVSSNLNLATIYKSRGNTALARNHLETVLEASPGNQQAALMLQQLGR
ncbi:MAG: hypothetical protein DMG13_01035 [Acidobacteria bacterium]|nr:MAG: hypothetical protein DMG13_01035 [Acidobacteriota bacterium]